MIKFHIIDTDYKCNKCQNSLVYIYVKYLNTNNLFESMFFCPICMGPDIFLHSISHGKILYNVFKSFKPNTLEFMNYFNMDKCI